MTKQLTLVISLLFSGFLLIGRDNSFTYKRELYGVKNEWHRIVLPDDLFGKIKPDFSDLRIIAINKKDTVQIPYLLKVKEDKNTLKEESFRIINRAENKDGFYYTFEMPAEKTINQIIPEFRLQNFDWKVNLEGKNNLESWYSILKDYRISAFHNDSVGFRYTKIVFPDSRYRYFRLWIKSKTDPGLTAVKMYKVETVKGESKDYPYRIVKSTEDKQLKKSEFYLELPVAVPVAGVSVFVKDTVDYYRPLKIEYPSDSVQTEEGWNYIYSGLANSVINSHEKNNIVFKNTILKKLRITITNYDNLPLRIDSFKITGYLCELTGRFDRPAKYYLMYGNKKLSKPVYDLEHFTDRIPSAVSLLEVGKEESAVTGTSRGTLFSSSLLWAIMLFIVALLGWLTLKMMRNRNL